MADSRSIVTGVSVAAALLCATWALYSTKHAGQSSAPSFAGPPGGGGASAAPANRPAAPAIVVVTAPARNEQIDVGIEAIGTANSNEAVSVTSKTSNLVTAIHFRDGEQVTAGQVLVELDRNQAAAELAAATADYGNSVSLVTRSRELLSTQALSKSQFEQLESTMKGNEAKVAAAKAKVTDTYIRAPFTGRVGLRRVSLGALINPGAVITTLDDISSIKVDFSVPDLYVGELREGQTITARSTAYAGRVFEGRVVSVDSRIDATTRSVTVRALVPNRDAALKPGMFLTVELAKEKRRALVIPEEALVPEQARQFVYVMSDGTVAKREVRIGRRAPGRVEVSEGLKEGDRVVTEGTLKLREGAAVRELQVAGTSGGPAAT